TVSRALTGHSDVSEATRTAVMGLAKKLSYLPDPNAVGLRQNKTFVIGIIVPRITNRFFSKAISGIEKVANSNGYKIMVTQSSESFEIEEECIATMLNNRVDGLIVSLSRQTTDLRHFTNIIESDIPVVLFDRVDESMDVSKVIIDDYEASYKLTEHFIEQGCKKIGKVAGPQNLVTCKNRLNGYKDALKDYELEFDEDWLVFSEYYTDKVKKITQYYTGLENRPDAIMTINDSFAMEMMHYLKEMNIRIPQDIALAGFNNEHYCNFLTPTLTSVEIPADQLGHEAALLLMDQLGNPTLSAKRKLLKSKLVIRNSTRLKF
ncbi:MAG: LacI family DNA-binding transcriptional regulator, partial [Bacteroidota bacterium]